MADAPQDVTPTYTVTDQGGVTHYTCLVPDASRPGGVCSHDATDMELFTAHMDHRHAGIMIAAPPLPDESHAVPPPVDTDAEDVPAPTPDVVTEEAPPPEDPAPPA
jgi:hypothetical protein